MRCQKQTAVVSSPLIEHNSSWMLPAPETNTHLTSLLFSLFEPYTVPICIFPRSHALGSWNESRPIRWLHWKAIAVISNHTNHIGQLHDDDLATTRQAVRCHHQKTCFYLPVRRNDFGSLVEGDTLWAGVAFCLQMRWSMEQLWRRCGGDVAAMWRQCGGDVAAMWRRCGGNVAAMRRRCGGDVAAMWRRCGGDVAAMWRRCVGDVMAMWWQCGGDVMWWQCGDNAVTLCWQSRDNLVRKTMIACPHMDKAEELRSWKLYPAEKYLHCKFGKPVLLTPNQKAQQIHRHVHSQTLGAPACFQMTCILPGQQQWGWNTH